MVAIGLEISVGSDALRYASNVVMIVCNRPRDGSPAAALEFPVRNGWPSSSLAVQVPRSVVTHHTGPVPASSLTSGVICGRHMPKLPDGDQPCGSSPPDLSDTLGR